MTFDALTWNVPQTVTVTGVDDLADDGTVFYTVDVESMSGSAGGRHGIDIEFAGRFDAHRRLAPAAIRAGRNLLRAMRGMERVAKELQSR